jgi:hypothetical protein
MPHLTQKETEQAIEKIQDWLDRGYTVMSADPENPALEAVRDEFDLEDHDGVTHILPREEGRR